MTTTSFRRLLMASALTPLFAFAAAAEPVHLTILHVNDLDRMEESGGQGGMARLMGVVNAERAARDNVLLTNGGDAISPSLMSGFDQGAHMIDLYNAAGFDVMVTGNHEYDFGPAIATQRIGEANFPVLASNAIDADGEILDGAVRTWTTEVGGFTIGFFGLTTLSTAVKSSPGSITFAPVEATSETIAQELRDAGADLVIAIAHTDLGEDERLRQLAAADLILSGDDHILSTFYNGNVAFVESASQADYVTAIDLTLDRVERRGRERFVWSPAFRLINTATVEPDAAMAEKVDGYLEQLSAELDVEIGSTTTEIDSRRQSVRTGETAIGNLITDAMRTAVGADVAITNGGGIRADKIYEPGTTLTRRDIQSELPFGNKTVLLELDGAGITAALENGFSAIEDVGGRFPHVSGMSVVYDPNAAAGSRVVSVDIGGMALDPGKTYTVATNDFMANGGDGYSVFSGAPNIIDPAAAKLMAAQVIEHIEAAGTISPEVEGRLQVATQ